MKTNQNITNLEALIDFLPASEKALFRRIYEVTTTVGELRIPKDMEPWVRQRFGSVEAVTRQKIVRVTNLVTQEEALFNRLRCFRPIEFQGEECLASRLSKESKEDLFSNPRDNTPEDLFGRISGRHSVTASNIAKYDGLHGVVISNDYRPLKFSREQVIDYIDTSWEWAQRAHAHEPQARYFFLIWNCLWRAGASIYHGHAQVMLAQGRHYAKIERLRRSALEYRQRYDSDYFSDLFRTHHALGCAVAKGGVKVLAHLSPFKDNEVIIIANELGLSFKERLYEVLACYRDRLGIASFNLALVTPPLAETEENWDGFPVVAWLVDRGSLESQASDIGGMEIYAASVVASDPFELASGLRKHLA
jgi:hypothetical protein